MTIAEILVVAVGLAMDAFAVSLGAGAGGRLARLRPAVRLSFHLGLFQALMPVLGWLIGTGIATLVARWSHWLALALLGWVGGRMVLSGLRAGDGGGPGPDPSRGMTMVMLSVATSIDAFAVGLSLAMLEVAVWLPSVIIGCVTGALSMVGIALGHRLGSRFGRCMEIIGGLLLIGIGVRIVVAQLT